MTASTETMAALHEALAKDLADRLRNGEQVVTKDGEVVTVKPPAATLNVVRQFLKDNGIEAIATRGSPMQDLIDSIPMDDEDQPKVVRLGRR